MPFLRNSSTKTENYSAIKVTKASDNADASEMIFPETRTVFTSTMQRRLVTSAATRSRFAVAPSSLPKFPPKESYTPPKDTFGSDEVSFDPASWASLQPPPSTALSAFAHRIGLNSIFYAPDVIRQACTHESYLPLFRKHYPDKTEPKTNKQLASLGNSLMGMFAAEWVHARWPYLPTRVMKSVVTALVGPPTSESVAREMGGAPLLRWHRTVSLYFLDLCLTITLNLTACNGNWSSSFAR